MSNERNRFHPNRRRIEIHLTAACNMRCYNCCSSCRQAPSEDSLELETIEAFVRESIDRGWDWEVVAFLGGEPTLHPRFEDAVRILKAYKDFNPDCYVKVKTNGRGRRVREKLSTTPDWVIIENSTKAGLDKKFEVFCSFNVAPIDLPEYRDADFSLGCCNTEVSGMGLFVGGYYACTTITHIDRVMGLKIGLDRLEDLEEPALRNQLRTACRYCGFFKDPLDTPGKEVMSPTWIEAYRRYNQRPVRPAQSA